MRRILPLLHVFSVASGDVVQPQSINHPELNSSASGQVALVGQFDSLSTVDYVGESSVLAPISDNDNLVSQSSGAWQFYLSASFADGTVSGACLLDNGVAILSGNFTELRGTSAEGIARLDLNSGAVSSLGNISLAGAVSAVWCNGSVAVVGGAMQLGESQGVGVWNDTAQEWSVPAFGGFPLGSSVTSIIPLTSDSVLFGGTLGAPLVGARGSTNPLQLVGFAGASVTATNNASDPSNILCSSGDPYEATSGSTTSVITVDLGHTVSLSEITLINPNSSSGTQQFRLVTAPSDSIMNLSYTDDSGSTQYCDAKCPLRDGATTTFGFVNQVGTHNLTISLLEYYGDHAALQGIELYTNTSFVYANNEFNSGLSCQSVASAATVDLGGSGWQVGDDYESVNVTTGSGLGDVYVRYYPNVTTGNYSLNLYTPGCAEYDTCSDRGQVNVTVYPGVSSDSVSLQLYQTNEEIKYDPIYNGTLEVSDGYPYVEVTPVSGQNTPIEFVASYLELEFVAATASVEIGSLFEYSVSNYTTYASDSSYEPVGATVLNQFGQDLGDVQSLATFSSSVYIGGNLSSGASLYALDLSSSNATVVSTEGVVEKLYTFDSSLLAVQDYNGVYNVSSSYNTVLNAPVNNIAMFNLNGTAMLAFSVNGGTDLSLYNLSSGDWYNGTTSVAGHISETLVYNSSNFYFGSIQVQEASAAGAASVSSSLQVGSLPFELVNSTSTTKRDTSSSSPTGVLCGAFYDSANILGGHFTATTSDGSTATNLLLVNGSISSALSGISSDWTIEAMAVTGSTLVLAGDVGTSLAVYSLSNNTATTLESNGTVDSLLARGDTVVLVGTFTAGGCSDFCVYNTTSNTFSTLSSPGGTIGGAALWSGDQAVLFGDFGSNSSLVQYGFNSGQYTAYTDTGISGTITGLTVGQASSKFLAVSWQNTTGGNNVQMFDGKTWTTEPSPVTGKVTSLSLLSTTTGNSSTLGNNMLAMNGALTVPDYGNCSVASFDGSTWLPLFVASSGTGTGSVAALYSEKQQIVTTPTIPSTSAPTTTSSHSLLMSKGRIVGISFAIAIGCISLLVILGLIWGYFTQRRQFYHRASGRGDDAVMAKHGPPEQIMPY